MDHSTKIAMAVSLAKSFLENATVGIRPDDIPAIMQSSYDAIDKVDQPREAPLLESIQPEYEPAVSVRKSLANPDHIISMIDGKPYRALRRHLTTHGLTPAEYRERYGLKADYPMVAPSYTAMRSQMAKDHGLGRKPGTKVTKG